jgi:hypothetical protein
MSSTIRHLFPVYRIMTTSSSSNSCIVFTFQQTHHNSETMQLTVPPTNLSPSGTTGYLVKLRRWERIPSLMVSTRKKYGNCKPSKAPTKSTQEDQMNESMSNIRLDHSLAAPGTFQVIGQDEFLVDCNFDGMSIVHVYDKHSDHCEEVDAILQDMPKRFPGCNFYRIDGREAPLVSSELMVTRFPTVLAIKDSTVRGRIGHFGESDYFSSEDESKVLRRWVAEKITGGL